MRCHMNLLQSVPGNKEICDIFCDYTSIHTHYHEDLDS